MFEVFWVLNVEKYSFYPVWPPNFPKQLSRHKYYLEKMSSDDTPLFNSFVYYKSEIISVDINRNQKVAKSLIFLSSGLPCESRYHIFIPRYDKIRILIYKSQSVNSGWSKRLIILKCSKVTWGNYFDSKMLLT